MTKIIHCSITCISERLEIIKASELVKLIMVQPYMENYAVIKKNLEALNVFRMIFKTYW